MSILQGKDVLICLLTSYSKMPTYQLLPIAATEIVEGVSWTGSKKTDQTRQKDKGKLNQFKTELNPFVLVLSPLKIDLANEGTSEALSSSAETVFKP